MAAKSSTATFCSLLLKLILTAQISYQQTDGPIVQTVKGPVQGKIASTPQGRVFYSFKGIPFAKAPIEGLRFQAPIEADSWTEVLDASTDPPMCPQPVFGPPLTFTGVEDCLQLNLYTPILPTSEQPSLPVHVFIHGGDYFGGEITSTVFGPERYMNTDMVLVLVNYRLSAIGFLSTADDAASGNFGLLDQNMALRWVRDNIATFGGNPNDVVLSGQSAGSASVISHILSPMSAGLFHRAIAESGSALCPWAMVENPLQYAEALGAQFQCPTDNTLDLVACLRQQDAGEIIIKTVPVMVDNLTLSFVPVQETPSPEHFLTEDPMTSFQEGTFNKVPMIMGINRDEGTLLYRDIYPLFDNIDDNFFDYILPTIILPMLTDFRNNLINVSYAIKDEYYSKIDLQNETQVTRTSIDLLSDMYMKTWSVQTAQLISSHGIPVYIYAFNYVSQTSTSNFTGEPDVNHGIELWYLFNETSHVISDIDQDFGQRFFTLWKNFILNGDPTPSGAEIQWLPSTSGESKYLDIDTVFTMSDEYDPERMNFWTNTLPAIVNA